MCIFVADLHIYVHLWQSVCKRICDGPSAKSIQRHSFDFITMLMTNCGLCSIVESSLEKQAIFRKTFFIVL